MSASDITTPPCAAEPAVFPAPQSVVIDIPAGCIRLEAADRADAVVEVRPADPDANRDVAAARQIRVGYADGVLRVEVEPSRRNRILGDSGRVELTVRLPAGCRVDAKTATGGLRGTGPLGRVAFEGAVGEVRIDEAAGARLTMRSGPIVVGRLTEAAEISTQAGDITVGEAVRGALVLRTQSGDIRVGTAPGVSAALDAGTAYGRIDNALQNDGTPVLTIHATTGRGDVVARSR